MDIDMGMGADMGTEMDMDTDFVVGSGEGGALKSVGHYSIPEMELRGSQYVQWF
jgi:hypothetical protein